MLTWWPRPAVAALAIQSHGFFGHYRQRQGGCWKFKDERWVEKYGARVLAWLQIIFHHPFICRGALHSFKLNTLVSGKLWSGYVLFQEGGIQIGSSFPIFILKFLTPTVLHLLYVSFFPLQIQLWKLNQQQWDAAIKISHIMLFFVLTRSMCLFLAGRQLHKTTLEIGE